MTAFRVTTVLFFAAAMPGVSNCQTSILPPPSAVKAGVSAVASPPPAPALGGPPAPVGTSQKPDDGVLRVEWFERMIVGESEQSLDPFLETNAGPPVSHQQAGRPGQTLAAPGPGPQAAIVARQATANEAETPVKPSRINWLRQLLWGDSADSEQLLTSPVTTSSTVQTGHNQPLSTDGDGSKSLVVTGVPAARPTNESNEPHYADNSAETREKGWLRRLISGDSAEEDTTADEVRKPESLPTTPSRWSLPSAVEQQEAASTTVVSPLRANPQIPTGQAPKPAPGLASPVASVPVSSGLADSYEDLVRERSSAPQQASMPPISAPASAGASPAPEQMLMSSELVANNRAPAADPFDERPTLDTLYPGEMPTMMPELASPDSRPTTSSPFSRPKILFRPIARATDSQGTSLLRPSAQIVVEESGSSQTPIFMPAQDFAAGEDIPPPEMPAETYDVYEEQWAPTGTGDSYVDVGPWRKCWYTLLANLNGPRSCPPGIGIENVMNAPFWLDTTQPLQNCRIRADAAADWEFPDRLEYFWPRTPGGAKSVQEGEFGATGGEPELDYQELSFYIERGGDRFSVGTELPIIVVDPVVRRNTAGFGDMKLTTKLVLLDGRDWQLTQVTHAHFPTGSFRRGTGNGHFSMEPGVAWRYKWSDVTYFHGDLTYWIPIAADLEWSGQFFNYGIGISHILYDSDSVAVIPTFEIDAWTLLDGRETLPGIPPGFNEIDTYSVLNLHPGLRIVCDTAGDCGVREFGITSGIAVTQEHWYSEIIRLELRWVF